ncbi:sulfite reductase subunit alpha [Achromobacter kerstersii]|uniref:sulfite reductase subunit alpha n=1 Tax=Achromobacter kerstersii TaxID=1353890 RepID=UPI0006C6D799|nr:sulfite reductase subunit alpha [Achromobacter kerstersii]CUJ24780.1 Sulfite reductase [NADPH] flavoprotein alpha-component [Achromobacter kerstersii]
MSLTRLIAAACVVGVWLLLCLWAWRRARQHDAQQAQALAALNAPAPDDTMLVAYATQTGYAESLAAQTAESLRAGGLSVRVAALDQLDVARLSGYRRMLFVASTYGEGDPPDAAAAFAGQMQPRASSPPAAAVTAAAAARNATTAATTAAATAATTATDATAPALSGAQYAVLALGDSEYAQFCGFGHRLNDWLHEQGATPLFDLVEVDNGDPAALRHWQHHLGLLAGRSDLPDWQAPVYETWRLTGRKLLNPDSQGGPCYLLTLTPPAGQTPHWLAGDIAEIGPRQERGGALLAHREYSIASVPEDGSIQLLVRQMRSADGGLGVGSGWLTHIARVGDEIDLRVRTNRNFHAPIDDRPLILIGNGTGLAGLRALIKARRARGHHRNWLVFGERNAAHDAFCGDEITAWRIDGTLARVDTVYSRDQPQRRYVQHLLREQAGTLRDWVEDGAAIYVCGSLQGMAGGVDAALQDILGDDRLQALQHDGRYRRDVY